MEYDETGRPGLLLLSLHESEEEEASGAALLQDPSVHTGEKLDEYVGIGYLQREGLLLQVVFQSFNGLHRKLSVISSVF